MLGMEGARLVEPAGDQRRRHELGIVEHEQLFGRVADGGGVVDHQSLVLDPFEQVGRGDVGEIEGRILPHQHHVGVLADVERHDVAEGEMIAGDRPDSDGAGRRGDAAIAVAQVARGIMIEPMAACLRGEHQGEGRVACDLDRLHGVHLDGDGKAHVITLLRMCRLQIG